MALYKRLRPRPSQAAKSNGHAPGTLEEGMLALAPPASFLEAAQEAMAKMDEAVKEMYGDEASVFPCGSFVQGLPLESSALDLCIDVPGDTGFSHGANSGNRNHSAQTSFLQRLLGKLMVTGSFRLLETRFGKQTETPIIVLRFESSQGQGVETHISVGIETDGVRKDLTDRIVRRLLAYSPRALHLARLVKLWARASKLNKAYDGFLSSLGWMLLVLYFFIEKGELSNEVVHFEEPDELGHGGDRSWLPPALHCSLDAELMLEEVPSKDDLADFFEWVTATVANWPEDPPGGAWAISIVDGTLIEVLPPDKKCQANSKFYLEDPGSKITKDISKSIARSLTTGSWKTTLDQCKSISAKLRAQSPEDASAWFTNLLQQSKAETEGAGVAANPAVTKPLGAGVQRSWEAAADNARTGTSAPKASTPLGGVQRSWAEIADSQHAAAPRQPKQPIAAPKALPLAAGMQRSVASTAATALSATASRVKTPLSSNQRSWASVTQSSVGQPAGQPGGQVARQLAVQRAKTAIATTSSAATLSKVQTRSVLAPKPASVDAFMAANPATAPSGSGARGLPPAARGQQSGAFVSQSSVGRPAGQPAANRAKSATAATSSSATASKVQAPTAGRQRSWASVSQSQVGQPTGQAVAKRAKTGVVYQ